MPAATRPDGSPTTVVLGVSGSIAAYKAALVARSLVKQGVRVLPVMTRAALQFLGPSTLAGICSAPVRSQMFDAAFPGELHVELAAQADLIALVPATAELLGAMAQGRADELLRALVLCSRVPVLAAPAMHPRMWTHPATQRSVSTLLSDGRVELVGPVVGEVASGDVGEGRMAEPEVIVEAILARLAATAKADLSGRRVLVTAGPTVEDIDPARFLSNRSSGKMGFALARRAAERGAAVTLVSGPVSLGTPAGVTRIDVRSALEMRDAMWDALGGDLQGVDALVMTAAVADYRPAESSESKLKRDQKPRTLELLPNPDLLAEVGAKRQGNSPVLVGFALETVDGAELVRVARGKLQRKGVDLVVANRAADAFDKDDNRATLVTREAANELGRLSKLALADVILDGVAELWASRGT